MVIAKVVLLLTALNNLNELLRLVPQPINNLPKTLKTSMLIRNPVKRVYLVPSVVDYLKVIKEVVELDLILLDSFRVDSPVDDEVS